MSSTRDVLDKKIGNKVLRKWRHISTFTVFHGLSAIFVGISLSVQADSYADGYEVVRKLQCKENINLQSQKLSDNDNSKNGIMSEDFVVILSESFFK